MFQSAAGFARRLTLPAADRSRAALPKGMDYGEMDFIDGIDRQTSFLPEGRGFRPIRNV